jgi:hypothetical protein
MRLTEDQFDELKPVTNPHADRGYNRTLFETYGVELNFVKSQPDNKVWTLLDSAMGEWVIVSGMRTVDRLGYFVTEEPWTEETEVS